MKVRRQSCAIFLHIYGCPNLGTCRRPWQAIVPCKRLVALQSLDNEVKKGKVSRHKNGYINSVREYVYRAST